MARFKEGQEVICTLPNNYYWVNESNNEVPGPRLNDIVTVSGYEKPGYIFLKEYPNQEGYTESEFEPTMNITELTEILEQEPATA